MTRLLLPASAVVLVLTACGAGAKPASRAAEVRRSDGRADPAPEITPKGDLSPVSQKVSAE